MLLGGTARERDTELTSIAQILPLCHDWSDNLDAFFTLSRKLEFISCQKRILRDYLLKDILTELHQHFLFELVHVRCFEFVSVASLHKRGVSTEVCRRIISVGLTAAGLLGDHTVLTDVGMIIQLRHLVCARCRYLYN